MKRDWRNGWMGASMIVSMALAILMAMVWNRTAVCAATTSVVLNYASPLEMLYSADGKRLYVLCGQSGEVRVMDAATYVLEKTVVVGHLPRGFAFSPDGARLFVVNSWDDSVSVIDTRALEVVATWPVGMEPSSIAEDAARKFLYVANRISNDIAVLDARTGAVRKRLAAGRGASYMAMAPDGQRLYVTHVFPNPGPYRTLPISEITVVDTGRAEVADRIALRGIAGVFHAALTSNGRLGVVAELHPKNLLPLTALEHGATFQDSITLFGAATGGRAVELPLDELERYAARPFGVVFSRDQSRLYVTSGGSAEVTVIDVGRMLRYVRGHRGPFASDLSASSNYVMTRVAVGQDPRGMALSPHGRRLLVANRLDDTISVIDTKTNLVVQTIRLARSPERWSLQAGEQMFAAISDPPKDRTECAECHLDERHRQAPSMHLSEHDQVAALRRGEQTFYTSKYSLQGQIGCANCHIDSSFDAMQWDLEPDGLARNILDNRLLEDIQHTAPFKWNGGNPNLPTECGPRTEKYFWRSENYDMRTLADLTAYVNSLPARPNRWRKAAGLTAAQERGQVIFERSVDNFGKPIPLGNRCSYCHSGLLGTDRKSFNVGTQGATDDSGLFDTPHLVNIALTAPYLHDGRATTLEEIWTIYNPQDQHGRTNDLTKDELNDLIEYLKTR